MRVGVDCNPFKHSGVTKSAVQLPVQYRSEIDLLLRSIVESDVQHEGLDDLERRDAMKGMCHADLAHRNGWILSGARPACSRFQSAIVRGRR